MAPKRGAKRRRLSASKSQDSPPDKHELFTQWATDRGVEIGSVKPASLPARGFGLVTTAKIKKDEQILFVPEKAMFKPNMKIKGLHKASPQARLALSLMRECQQRGSPFRVWRATWPTREDFDASMPLFWDQELKDMLPPTVQQPLERQRADWMRDLRWYLDGIDDHGATDMTTEEDDFVYYWAIVNSRSFHFKPPGIMPGYMVLCPFIDYMNHGPAGTTVNVRQTPKGYEVVADRDYARGEEIIANYGAHTNDKLLVHYGFINSNPPGEPSDDDIRLDHIILHHLSESTKQQLQDVGYLGSYALLPATNELCFKTQVAIRAELLSANEWEYFIANGEDMGMDEEENVMNWLVKYLVPYRDEAEQKMLQLEEVETGPASLIRGRWKQIFEALDAYLKTTAL